MKTVITYGVFDLFHEGHRNLLKGAKALGDYLIVGVTTEQYDETRGKLNIVDSLSERIENVRLRMQNFGTRYRTFSGCQGWGSGLYRRMEQSNPGKRRRNHRL